MTNTGKHVREGGSNVKRKKLAVAVAAMCCALMGGGTLAYFTDSDTAHNVITSGGVDITLNEWADKPQGEVPFEDVEGVMPGQAVTKVVEVKNTGANEAWVRVEADMEVLLKSASQGESIPDPAQHIMIDYNRTDWTLADGYWYYNTALDAGETTAPLFTKVTFDESMGNVYQGCTVIVDVSAQAVQVANNGGPEGDDVFAATGWPIKQEGQINED